MTDQALASTTAKENRAEELKVKRRDARRRRILENSSTRMQLVNGERKALKETTDEEKVKSIENTSVEQLDTKKVEDAAASGSISFPKISNPAERRREALARRRAKEKQEDQKPATDSTTVSSPKAQQEAESPSPATCAEESQFSKPKSKSTWKNNTPQFHRMIIQCYCCALICCGIVLAFQSNVSSLSTSSTLSPSYHRYEQLLSQGLLDLDSIREQMRMENLDPEKITIAAESLTNNVLDSSWSIVQWWTRPPVLLFMIIVMRGFVWLVFQGFAISHRLQALGLGSISSSGMSTSNLFSAQNTSMMAMGARFVLNSGGSVLGILPRVIKELYLLSHDFCIVIFTQAMTLACFQIYGMYSNAFSHTSL